MISKIVTELFSQYKDELAHCVSLLEDDDPTKIIFENYLSTGDLPKFNKDARSIFSIPIEQKTYRHLPNIDFFKTFLLQNLADVELDKNNVEKALIHHAESKYKFGMYCGYHLAGIVSAKKGGKGKVLKDPLSIAKQAQKSFIHDCWKDWQKKPERYAKQSDFVTDVLSKIDIGEDGQPLISFDTVLKKWIPSWTNAEK